jgi:hypothetical protein
MKTKLLIAFMLCGYIYSFSQCIQEPVYLDLDNSIDTIDLTGRCGNPLDEPNTDFLEPENFGYIKNGANFLIDCGFAKNCARVANLIIQANDTLITIAKHEVDTGEATTCEDYEMFTFWFPLSSKGYFHVQVNGFDTIISGLTGIYNTSFESIRAYPNPTSYELKIDFNNNFNSKLISVFNVNGQLIFKQLVVSDSYNLNTSGFKKGNYLVQVVDKISDEIILTRQIIKE